MALYCDPDELDTVIGEGIIDDADLVEFVRRASNRVQDEVGDYWPFPEYSATPPTPEIIREATLRYATYLAYERLSRDNYLAEGMDTEWPREEFQRITARIRRREDSIALVTISDEELSFGTGAVSTWDGYENAHVLAQQNCEIVESTARISGRKRAPDGSGLANPGGDFRIVYEESADLWLLWRLNTEIEDGETVSYAITWRKWRETATERPAGTEGRIRLG